MGVRRTGVRGMALVAQMGPAPRGSAYTYDWIENRLGLDMHSVDRLLPEFEHPHVGDMIAYGSNRMRLERVESERVLVWRSEDGNWVWSFVLDGRDGSTRLISRNRFRLPHLRLGSACAMEPASLVMERKMLYGTSDVRSSSPQKRTRTLDRRRRPMGETQERGDGSGL